MSTVTCVFDRKNRATTRTAGMVEIRFTIQRKSYYISTGVKVLKDEWKFGSVVDRPDSDSLNRRLATMVTKANEEITRCIEKEEPISVSKLRMLVTGERAVADDREPEVLTWVQEQIPLLQVSEGTRKHYKTMFSRLAESGMMRHWYEVTVENIHKWDAWLHTLRTKDGEKFGDGTVYNYHKCFRALLSRADMYGIIDRNPYERLHGQFRKGYKETVDYLTESQMRQIMDLVPEPGGQMAMARDLFIFQMATGLSYSDAQAFDVRMYRREPAGEPTGTMVSENDDSQTERWVFIGQRIKTGVPYVSMLLPPAVDVLKRNGWQVPKINNQRYNQLLKAIGMCIGVPGLHSHMARHTFATFMLSQGVRIENVSKMLGHTDIKMTQRYAKVLARDIYADYERVARNMR